MVSFSHLDYLQKLMIDIKSWRFEIFLFNLNPSAVVAHQD
jgi:hypothetical protein